jgi:hypothetical protein
MIKKLLNVSNNFVIAKAYILMKKWTLNYSKNINKILGWNIYF